MKKVLLIEDDFGIVWVVKAMLEKAGFEVVHALDSDFIKRYIPQVDLVVSDFHFGLPDMQFKDVQKICAELNKPLILQSGGMLDPIHSNQLAKPYTRDQFMDMVKRLVPVSNSWMW